MKWNSDYLLRVIADEYVLVPVAGEAAKSSQIIAINQTAGEICTLVLQGLDETQIINALADEYEVDRETIAEDLSLTLQQLLALHALVP